MENTKRKRGRPPKRKVMSDRSETISTKNITGVSMRSTDRISSLSREIKTLWNKKQQG
ncbi:hypothetical protein [Ruminococcus albus]|uniref:Uncharacterized protein n=1 Tax=Ruminococcus albus (strain ATCC 27210 / DSM 20455 / JCM 14654 / NCDO 2250 / 7) TaxID=697329 RepID=E6UCV2_RUMA7|nr:hypothetical protein [Ruminococcus albus]ADU22781.1 hypothetical protein Rumal_2297 [Ruminococcus albus 7 = DSM 20455]